MAKRCDIEDVRKEFEAEGYILVTDTYKNAHTKLEYICPKGHSSNITFSNWHFGKKRCKYCSNQAPVNYNDVKETFEKEGYILLSKEYIKASAKLDYICPKGTYGSIPWNSFQQGHRCQCCYGKNNKLTFEEVKKSFEERGAILLDKEYINSKIKLNYICSNGHKHNISWDSWASGHGCQTCAIIRHTGAGNPSWKGGVSFEPYCHIWSDEEYKKDIKERDSNKCLNPCCEGKTGKAGVLSIHHIDYKKKNCDPINLITLCISCNSKANIDREWHEAWYKAIMNKRYNRGVV